MFVCVFLVSRAGESLRNCPYFAVWSLDAVVEMTAQSPLLDVLVHERSLSRGLPFTCPPPEQFFNPTTYNFGEHILHLAHAFNQSDLQSWTELAMHNLQIQKCTGKCYSYSCSSSFLL